VAGAWPPAMCGSFQAAMEGRPAGSRGTAVRGLSGRAARRRGPNRWWGESPRLLHRADPCARGEENRCTGGVGAPHSARRRKGKRGAFGCPAKVGAWLGGLLECVFVLLPPTCWVGAQVWGSARVALSSYRAWFGSRGPESYNDRACFGRCGDDSTVIPHRLYYNLKYIYIGLRIVSHDIQTDGCCVWCLDFCTPNLPSSRARLPGWEDPPSRLQPFEQNSLIFMSLCDIPDKQWLMCNWLCIYKQSPPSSSPWAIAQALVTISPCPWFRSLNSLRSLCSKHLLSRFMLYSCLPLGLSTLS
jgi:hypothetical protein